MNPLRAKSFAADGPETLWLGGYPVLRACADTVGRRLLDAVRRGEQRVLLFANTNFVVQCRGLRQRLLDPAVTIANDGIGMELAARLVHRRGFVENLNGTDFTPRLLEAAHLPVFLVGARPGVAQRAAERLRAAHGVEVVGACDGYTGTRNPAELVDCINASGAGVVLVALGNPLQERWILEHRARLQARLLVGVGALFDFLAGDKPRAPALVRRTRLEWLFRLALEPRRLLRRYTVDVAVFFALCLAHRRGGAPSGS